MPGTIIQVWFEQEADVVGHDGRQRFYIIETNLPDWGSVCDMLDTNRMISGDNLSTKRTDEYGVMEIHHRRPIAFRGAAVLRCELPRFRYVEDNG